jgi:predicted ferric reductase
MQFGIACGFVALSIMSLEYAMISKMNALASAFGQDALLRIHKLMGILATALVVTHVVLVVSAGYPLVSLNPLNTENPPALRWGAGAGLCAVALIFLSLFRRQVRLPYGWWQYIHRWLADAILLMGLAHVLLIGGFTSSPPMRVSLALYFAVIVLLGIHYRLVRPLRLRSRTWELIENRAERGDACTLVLKPHNHPGITFEPGQFAWLNTGTSPFHKDRHPISFSSVAPDEVGGEIAFTIRKLGDWSGTVVPSLKPGRLLWVDGPYGVFTADREQGMGYVLFGGGVGITPMMSICSTLAERGDRRHVVLFFASRDLDSLTFDEAWRTLQRKLDLKLVVVLEKPPDNWTGEKGFITKTIIEKHLPKYYKRYQYFICGPPPMMDAIEEILPSFGIPPQQIHSERFDMI